MEVETYLFLALPLLILTLTIAKFFGNDSKKLPPGSLGWPVIGENIDFLFGNPEKFVIDRMKKYSPKIFKTNILGEKSVVICGSDGHKFLFSNEQKLFKPFRPHSMQKLFRSYEISPVQLSREAETKLIKSPGFLKPEALVKYAGKMDLITQQQMRTYWEGKDEVNGNALTKRLTLTFACEFFLGIGDPDRIARLVMNFDCIALGMHSIPVNFPGTIFYRAYKAAAAVRKDLRVVINEKKAAIASGLPITGILSHMIMTTDPSGKHMAEAEIVDKTIGVLTAGYYTVATAMTFFIKYVGERPKIYRKILAEQMKVSAAKKSSELLGWDDIQNMQYSLNVIHEVLRLTPPIQGAFREALTDFNYAGYTIPKGWKVYWTVSSTNKNSEYFLEPEKFDPSRYDDDKTLPPFAFVPFGGGPRTCPAREYTKLAILTFVHNIVKRFRWELVCPEEKIIGDMIPAPEYGLPIRLLPHH